MVGIAFVLCAWLSWHVVACATTASRPRLLCARRTRFQLGASSGCSLCSQLNFTLMMSGCSPQVSCKVFSIWKRKRGFLPLCFFLLQPPDQFQGSTPSRSTSPPRGPRAAPPLAMLALLGLGPALQTWAGRVCQLQRMPGKDEGLGQGIPRFSPNPWWSLRKP